ncbi:MAG: carboxypeptidase regulatory-like domain-containing protein [Halocynthiibacter sp.]
MHGKRPQARNISQEAVFCLVLIWTLFGYTPAQAYEVVTGFVGGSIAGNIRLGDAIPRVKRYRISKDHDVCGAGTRDVSIVHANADALIDTVVYIEDIERGKAFLAAAKKVTINQLGCRFTPHLAVLANGGVMEVVNSDNVLHNIHAYEQGGSINRSILNASQPKRGNILTKTIDMNFGNAVRLLCDAHDFMRGYIFVASNPYYAVVDEQGHYTLKNVPPGTYRIKVWHAALGERSRTVTVRANQETSANFSF